MRQWLVVAAKEIKDNLRDKRAFFFAIVYGPVIMPLLIVGPMLLGAKTGIINFEEDTNIHVVGEEHAPNLIAHLKTRNLIAVPTPQGYKSKIREGDLDAVLEIPDDYGEKMRDGKPSPLYLYVNHSNKKSEKSARHIRSILNAYSGHLGYWRMQARGFDYQITQTLQVVEQDLSSEGFSGMLFGFLTYFIIVFTMMTGGFYLAVDITAGERERNSMEPLLTLPISRFRIVVGKTIAILTFVTLSGFLSTLSLFAIFEFFPLDELSVFLNLSGVTLAHAFLFALPCAVLVASLLMATAAFTKSAKEAQTYISLLYLLPMIPMFVGQFVNLKMSFLNMLIPFFSQYTLIDKTVKNETIMTEYVFASATGTILCAVILFGLSVRLYQREKILAQ